MTMKIRGPFIFRTIRPEVTVGYDDPEKGFIEVCGRFWGKWKALYE